MSVLTCLTSFITDESLHTGTSRSESGSIKVFSLSPGIEDGHVLRDDERTRGEQKNVQLKDEAWIIAWCLLRVTFICTAYYSFACDSNCTL